MRRAAEAIQAIGARAVLVKGGHRSIGNQALDILLDENGIFTEFQTDYIQVGEIHGSGCTLSAALAANLAKGLSLEESVASAKKYVTDAIRALQHASRIGHGAKPL
jgi:hydroxymethylpyrimidine kinase/phosphomethylpyrimidine kinase